MLNLGSDWTGSDWTGSDWTGLDWTGSDWTGSGYEHFLKPIILDSSGIPVWSYEGASVLCFSRRC